MAKATNENADGCFGDAVRAFAIGIAAVTGKPFTSPRHGVELAKLIDAMRAHCPNVAERTEWTRASAERFAREAKCKLNVHAFVDWLNSPSSAPKPVEKSQYDEIRNGRWFRVYTEDDRAVREEEITREKHFAIQ